MEKRNRQTAALTSQWVDVMEQKYFNQQDFTSSQNQIRYFQNQTLDHTETMDQLFLRNINGQQTEKVRKNIIGVFKGLRLKLVSKKQIFYMFHLICEMELIVLTTSQMILYIHSLSNHPPNIIKKIPNSIQKKLSKNRLMRSYSMQQNVNTKML